MSTFFVVIGFAALLYYVLSPLGEPIAAGAASRDLDAGIEGVLGNILDLDSDLETGKISREDYAAARAEAESRAAKLMKTFGGRQDGANLPESGPADKNPAILLAAEGAES
jgi:hypothetical protein